MSKVRFAVCLLALALVAAPALAVDRTIYNGIDLWTTRGDGSTFVDFSVSPLPAGFFCQRSEPFTGRVGFQGLPLATGVPGALGRTDTIVQRLDDAVFNKNGVAFTRLQVRALNFESIAMIKTACGPFKATVTLDGEQPITRMKIVRENAQGGRFYAPISVNVKISFTPVGRAATEPLEIRKSLRFPALLNQRWVNLPAQAPNQVKGFLLVDTDGDRVPDTYLPGTSNFGVGQLVPRKAVAALDCHTSDDCSHCVG
jgi:hypothetical protein